MVTLVHRLVSMIRRAARNDITDHFDNAECTEPIDPADPIEKAEAIEPMEPIDRKLPTEPIDRTEPLEPIDSTEFSDHNDRRQVDRFEARIGQASRAGDSAATIKIAEAPSWAVGSLPRDGTSRSSHRRRAEYED
jgi:hypothetical protein